MTYFAYQLVKRQTVRFRIKAIRRRVIDPAGDNRVDARPVRPPSSVAVLPSGILATQAKRLDVETAGRTSAAAAKANVVQRDLGGGIATDGPIGGVGTFSPVRLEFAAAVATREPITAEVRKEAVAAVDKDLVAAGVLDKNGKVAEAFRAELEFERTTCLPTQAIVVKGCLDKCNTCDEGRKKSIELDLVHKDLENKLLEKRIALLEKSQEYRCCPVGESEEDGD